MGIPVVIIRGMLEAGKTAFIKEDTIGKVLFAKFINFFTRKG